VISGNFLQDKHRKYKFISEDCKAKCSKTWKLVQNLFFCKKEWCSCYRHWKISSLQ